MKLDEQQQFQVFCAVLQGVAASTAAIIKPEKVVEKAIEITAEAIAAAMSGEHF
jgi:hypothetical protein